MRLDRYNATRDGNATLGCEELISFGIGWTFDVSDPLGFHGECFVGNGIRALYASITN